MNKEKRCASWQCKKNSLLERCAPQKQYPGKQLIPKHSATKRSVTTLHNEPFIRNEINRAQEVTTTSLC